jgi:hypothetical protein
MRASRRDHPLPSIYMVRELDRQLARTGWTGTEPCEVVILEDLHKRAIQLWHRDRQPSAL